ncbi:MAG: hypothetical protein P4L92_22895 [Rudaea sp.]|nr:hypothetical protein [Rudaea sp.]
MNLATQPVRLSKWDIERMLHRLGAGHRVDGELMTAACETVIRRSLAEVDDQQDEIEQLEEDLADTESQLNSANDNIEELESKIAELRRANLARASGGAA